MTNPRWKDMGLRTIQGDAKEGFFIPYRYAATVPAPGPYPAIEALFETAAPTMRNILGEMDARADELIALNGPPPRPRWDQDWFPRADGAAAYTIPAMLGSRQVVEVGSGHSTRFMFGARCPDTPLQDFICIDPEPRADIRALGVDWRAEVLSEDHLPLFEALGPGDIAFFDSSHILVPGCDVDIMLNRIFPVLKPGVIIHVHDILLPDPYPERWEWRGYAEQNGLAPWLLSGAMEPLFSSHYAVTRLGAASSGVLSRIPIKDGAIETSLWMRKR